jgi:hypothetical protein
LRGQSSEPVVSAGSFYRSWLVTALTPAWAAAGTISALIGFAALYFAQRQPAWGPTINDLGWQIPLATFGIILVARLAIAPYEIFRRRVEGFGVTEEELRDQIKASQIAVAQLEQTLEDQRPQLRIQINQIIVGNLREFGRIGIVVVVTVRNTGSDSIADHWAFRITPNGGFPRECDIQHVMGRTKFKTDVGVFSTDQAIYDQTAKPIPRGGLARGFLLTIDTEGMTREQIEADGTKLEVSCLDVTGRRVEAEHVRSEQDYPKSTILRHLPGFETTLGREDNLNAE